MQWRERPPVSGSGNARAGLTWGDARIAPSGRLPWQAECIDFRLDTLGTAFLSDANTCLTAFLQAMFQSEREISDW